MLSLTEHGVFVYPIGNGNQNKDIHMSDEKQLPEWITTTEASGILGLKRDTIAEYCRRYGAGEDDRLVCQKRGRDWWVSGDSVKNFKPDNKGRGRPRSTSD